MITIDLGKKDGTTVLLELHEDGDGYPAVIAGTRHYDSLHDLAADHPELADPAHLSDYCDLCLHFTPGPGCLLIRNPEEYRARYHALVQHGSTGGTSSLADFGPFDVSGIGAPQVENEKLVFYAEELQHGLPYRVETPWPARPDEEVEFLLLPLSE